MISSTSMDEDCEGAAMRTTHAAPPTLDQHGDSIRAWLETTR